MAKSSEFGPDGGGETRGGLDRYLGPRAIKSSKMPEDLEDGQVPSDAELDAEVDCDGADKDQDVCKIAEAEKRRAPKGAIHRPS